MNKGRGKNGSGGDHQAKTARGAARGADGAGIFRLAQGHGGAVRARVLRRDAARARVRARRGRQGPRGRLGGQGGAPRGEAELRYGEGRVLLPRASGAAPWRAALPVRGVHFLYAVFHGGLSAQRGDRGSGLGDGGVQLRGRDPRRRRHGQRYRRDGQPHRQRQLGQDRHVGLRRLARAGLFAVRARGGRGARRGAGALAAGQDGAVGGRAGPALCRRGVQRQRLLGRCGQPRQGGRAHRRHLPRVPLLVLRKLPEIPQKRGRAAL